LLWIKTLHVLAVMAWLSGLFYLPRILVNYVQARAGGEPTARLEGMAVRLFRFASILAVFALGFGLWLWLGYGISGAWLHWKLAFVLLLVAYHLACGRMVTRMKAGTLDLRPVMLRVFNEGSVLIVFAILVFVIVKPV
jgi:putative membrane protein